MTLLPADSRKVKGVDLPKYKCPSICSQPGCSRYADHAHHVWRRSFLGGDYAWVELSNHLIIGNLVPLCYSHHNDVTGTISGHKARIVWVGDEEMFYWSDLSDTSSLDLPLSWQPPKHGKPIEQAKVYVVDGPASNPICPGCKRPLAQKRDTRDPARRRKTWTIKVPDDTAEDGALVLDTLLDECARIFGHEEGKTNLRYFTIVQALALTVQNGHTFAT